ncbi:MAG TPA: ABC transporter permease subunit [Polyangiaceae bacterium]|nr:ABC transporter permease subunit [Polyangiaceae bacterium]
MPRTLSIRLVAVFDLLESLRSRKAIVLLALYMVGALGGSAIFVQLLTSIRERLEEDLGQKVDMQQLMSSPGMARVAGALTGDPEVARAILAIPPMAIFYGWLAMNFVPLLVLFTSADAISGDLSNGAVRFSLFRTDRISWATGKLIGQTCLMAVGVLAGALACWTIGAVWLDDMPFGQTAYWLLRISGRTIVYSFAYLGIVMCASQLARTPIRSGGLALLIMFSCSLAGGLFKAQPIAKRAPELFNALSKLFPNGHHLPLWHPGWFESLTAMLGLIAIGLAWFALGFWRFSRRDA